MNQRTKVSCQRSCLWWLDPPKCYHKTQVSATLLMFTDLVWPHRCCCSSVSQFVVIHWINLRYATSSVPNCRYKKWVTKNPRAIGEMNTGPMFIGWIGWWKMKAEPTSQTYRDTWMSSLRVSSKRKFVFKNCLQKSFWIKKNKKKKNFTSVTLQSCNLMHLSAPLILLN